jgi:DNA-binding transcriptional ArsR family regulator
MMTSSAANELNERLGRLSGEDASCCVPEYEGRSEAVRRLPRFPRALARAKALADENRLVAVALLKRDAELCACEIQAATGLTHATVSHHMAVLEDAGLVTSRREGKWLYYRLLDEKGVEIP